MGWAAAITDAICHITWHLPTDFLDGFGKIHVQGGLEVGDVVDPQVHAEGDGLQPPLKNLPGGRH